MIQTSGTIQWFLAFMPTHPEIQAKAHEELDRVLGRERWPTPEDERRLPYVRAIVKEVSVLPISLRSKSNSVGTAMPFPILDGHPPCIRSRFRVPRNVHPSEIGNDAELLLTAS